MSLVSHLKLKDLSIADFVAMTTSATIAVAVLFAIGFFRDIGPTFALLLTIQDVLILTALSLPIVFAIAYASIILDKTATSGGVWGLVAFSVVIIAVFVVATIYIDSKNTRFWNTIGLFGMVSTFIPVIYGSITKTKNYAALPAFYILLGLNTPVYLGSIYYNLNSESQASEDTVTTTDGKTIRGDIILSTSSYLFLKSGSEITIIRHERVDNVVRKLGLANG